MLELVEVTKNLEEKSKRITESLRKMKKVLMAIRKNGEEVNYKQKNKNVHKNILSYF